MISTLVPFIYPLTKIIAIVQKNFRPLWGDHVFQKKGRVIVQGDSNARTNVNNDTVTADKYDTALIENYEIDIPIRNSEDKVTADHRGKELIELCKSLGVIALNGRKIYSMIMMLGMSIFIW